MGISRGKGPCGRREARPFVQSKPGGRGTGEAKSPRVRLNKCTSPKLRFTASRGSASAPPFTSHRPRGSLRPPLGSNPGPRCSSVAAEWDSSAPSQRRFDQRTKTERRATILLPDPSAPTGRDAMDGRAKLFKENNTPGTGRHRPGSPQTHYECVAHRLNPCGDFSSPRGKRQCASQWRLAVRQRRRSLDSRVNAERAQASICCPSTRPHVSPPVNSGALSGPPSSTDH